MRSYEAARSLFSFMAFIAWSVIIIGGLVALIGAGSVSKFGGPGAGLLAMVPGIAIAMAGFLELAFIQMGRAGVDTAEYTQQMLKIARDQLEVSQQRLKASQTANKTFESVKREDKPATGFQKSDFAKEAKKASADALAAAKPQPAPEMNDGESIRYLGQMITKKSGMYVTGGNHFDSLLFAKSAIGRVSNITHISENEEVVQPQIMHLEQPATQSERSSVHNSGTNEYKGKSIVATGGQFLCNGIPFKTMQEARNYVDNFAAPPAKSLPGAYKPPKQ